MFLGDRGKKMAQNCRRCIVKNCRHREEVVITKRRKNAEVLNGHPIQGAKIIRNSKLIGVTFTR